MDRAAAQEMYRLTGQMGVPVTVIDGAAVVGFDRAGLEQALRAAPPAAAPPRPSFGLRIGDASRVAEGRGETPQHGAYVAGVNPQSAAGRAGLRAGDVVIEFNGQPVAGADDLEKAIQKVAPRSRVSVVFLRGGQRLSANTSV